jgi:uncharacterized protein DUF4242
VSSYLLEAYGVHTSLSEVAFGLRAAAEGTSVRYVQSIFIPADETYFHLLEGPSAEAVREVADRAEVCCNRIVEAVS